ncbi:MAG TPA: site-2 protease family protein, partial [Steroidobacteraceae bacterium]|nr:site-2 protease family protein [Steroidobacteraceae bacterium]
SLSLAFLNILPVPALDGGHLIIILVEAVLGRELSQKFKLRFQQVGVTVLLLLMVFMVFNDLRGL